ncbi:Holliday junction resolvase RuvX [Effusibacillus lacus]|uniref:Putative pre-16S rRNA nuclease n=1 Tax=Effusibacillus lacus TaxID=1348429 RepID=A0A292YPJ8_9BACL|nr:Holliday junction resolvase RuvX [Effusibacillus lacus]TCS72022.1 putative Holliday junction resolvase [Effusibacillus lacus]GAX90314.1 crossover junction endodeoxyribonuclease RuvA [Effusibacillus lacus]
MIGRIMGVDLGDVRIGVAVSDPLGMSAQGIEVIRRKSEAEDIKRIGELLHQYEVQKIVLGFPKNMNGTIGPRGEMTQQFATLLKDTFQLPVVLWDERLSTMAAERMLIEADVRRDKRKQVVDKMAAAIILQNYLDSL